MKFENIVVVDNVVLNEYKFKGNNYVIPEHIAKCVVLTKQQLSMTITDTNVTEVNALRRICLSEISIKILVGDLVTDDSSITAKQIDERIRAVPILQEAVEEGDMFALPKRFVNTNNITDMDITTHDLVYIGKAKKGGGLAAAGASTPKVAADIFDKMLLFRISAGKQAMLTCVVREFSSYGPACPCHTVIMNPTKEHPRDEDGIMTIPIHELNVGSSYNFEIHTNGTVPIRRLIASAFATMVAQCRAVHDLKHNLVENTPSIYTLNIPRHLETIIRVFIRYINDKYRVKHNTYCSCKEASNVIRWEFVTDNVEQFIAEIIEDTLEFYIAKYSAIEEQFKK